MKSAIVRKLALLAAAGLLAACANTSHVITGKPRAAIDPAQVALYTTPPVKYEEIAVIDASSQMSFAFGDQKKMDAVIVRLKKEAASLGANGVLLQGTGSGGGGVGTGVGIGHRWWRSRHRHRHILVKPEQDRPRPRHPRARRVSRSTPPLAGRS